MENKLASLLVVLLGKAFNGTPHLKVEDRRYGATQTTCCCGPVTKEIHVRVKR